jgi:uncharacterized protein (TIGR00297 family)
MDLVLEHILIISAVAIGMITLLIELSIRRGLVGFFVGRKLLHIFAVSICAFVIKVYPVPVNLGFLFMGCSVVLLLIIIFAKLLVQPDKSLGIALFPLAFGTMLLSGWFSSEIISISALILGISDPIAGMVGYFSKAKTQTYITEKKSWAGTGAFLLSTSIILLLTTTFSFIKIVEIAIIIALSEMYSSRGSDNFSIPWVSVFTLHLVGTTTNGMLNVLVPSILIGFAFLAYWRHWLDIGGAMAAWLIGVIIVWSYGESALFAPAFMLVAASLVPKFFGKKERSVPRNSRQVWANGLVAVCCIMIYSSSGDQWYFVFFLAAISVGICDTMSSEIGTQIRGKTIDISTLRPIVPGKSGGISWQGCLAGLISVLVFVLTYDLLFDLTMTSMAVITVVGFVGMLLDSWLGSRYQSLYNIGGTETEILPDHQNPDLVKGYHWIDNDVVNILSHILTIGLLIAGYELLNN